MKSSWQVSRNFIARSDGQRRWDYAYQFLLRWAMESKAGNCPAPSHSQEDRHGSRPVRTRIDQSATTDPDH